MWRLRLRGSGRQQLDYKRVDRVRDLGLLERVLYTKGGQYLAAARIEDTRAVIDHKLYWAAADALEEARGATGNWSASPCRKSTRSSRLRLLAPLFASHVASALRHQSARPG
jgi:hypothetical protein